MRPRTGQSSAEDKGPRCFRTISVLARNRVPDTAVTRLWYAVRVSRSVARRYVRRKNTIVLLDSIVVMVMVRG